MRVRRYNRQVHHQPRHRHGISHEVGSIEPGKLADIVLWKPAFFGAKPSMIIRAA